ncbi:MAG: DUF933 domain-containing protein, partial [Thermoleophilaceae bacterium]
VTAVRTVLGDLPPAELGVTDAHDHLFMRSAALPGQELDDAEAAAMREELHVGESGLATVVREAFALLDLISFFTAGQDSEARARAIRRGTRARQAAGAVHTDMERGFVAAEVTFWEDLVRAGGYAPAREQALSRLEGRDYEVRDGDVVTFRFTLS